ncbi:MAG: ABC transporter ATP-binding protein [Chloroflexota bacterium]
MTPTPLLSVDSLRAAYDGVPALHDVSFDVRAGEIVSIVGSNGAGKTTTLRAISGIVRGQGSVRFGGRDLVGLPAHRIAQLGIAHVPEGRHLFAKLTVEQNLRLGGYRRGDRAETVERVYATFPLLRERLSQRAGTLSGGEQQMLAIGRGLMLRPRLLMLDEPSLGIAPRLVSAIFEAVGRLRAEGLTILLVEQNVQESLELADRACVLQTGRIVLAGSGPELLESDLVRRAYLGL